MNYTLVRSRRRTITLQVSRAGELVVHAPLFYPKFLIDQFVSSKSRWITKRQTELAHPKIQPTPYFTTDQLKKYVTEKVNEYSGLMDLAPKALRFTQVTSYWGTCSPSGVLSFNLALRFTPPEAVTYVVVHELAHLRYRGHGIRFWQLVNSTFPQSAVMRKLLRKYRDLPH